MPSIPIAGDLAGLIGSFAERVENRSLLLEKFAFPKNWIDREKKRDAASRWSLLRITEEGSRLLADEERKERRNAAKGGGSKRSQNARGNADILSRLLNTPKISADCQKLRQEHSQRFLRLLRESQPDRAVVFTGRLKSRLALNLSEGLIENAGIALDRLFGMPYIPGSALKGCARHAALAEINKAETNELQNLLLRFIEIFGCSDVDFKPGGGVFSKFSHQADFSGFGKNRRGGVTFLPAYPVTEAHLEIDLSNVHTPEYYGGSGDFTPGDPKALAHEKPRPNPFPVVAKGACFGFAIALNSIGLQAKQPQSLLESGKHWLIEALTIHGIGAKTGAGLGWFSLAEDLDRKIEEETRREIEKAEVRAKARKAEELKRKLEEERRENLSPVERVKEEIQNLSNEEFANLALSLEKLPEDNQRAFLEVLSSSSKRSVLKKYQKGKKATDKRRYEIATAVAQKLNIPFP